VTSATTESRCAGLLKIKEAPTLRRGSRFGKNRPTGQPSQPNKRKMSPSPPLRYDVGHTPHHSCQRRQASDGGGSDRGDWRHHPPHSRTTDQVSTEVLTLARNGRPKFLHWRLAGPAVAAAPAPIGCLARVPAGSPRRSYCVGARLSRLSPRALVVCFGLSLQGAAHDALDQLRVAAQNPSECDTRCRGRNTEYMPVVIRRAILLGASDAHGQCGQITLIKQSEQELGPA
jgi:hypothetical protein